MTFRPLIHFAILSVFVSLVMAAEPIPESKRSELVKLLHYFGSLKDFHRTVAATIEETKKSVERPVIFWEDVERDVNLNQYTEWWISIVNERLSEKELIELNALFSSEEKMAIYQELGRISTTKKGQNHDEDVKALRDSKGAEAVDEVLASIRSDTFAKYYEATQVLQAGERDLVLKLVGEAMNRVTDKFNHARSVK